MPFILAAGGSVTYPTIFLSKSQTFVPPQDGNVTIHVIGAGGGGGGGYDLSAQSGAAGGYCKKNSLAVTTSSSFTVVVGAGGTGGYNGTGSGGTGNGGNGGNSTVAGTGLSSTLTANGGAGGTDSGTSAVAGGTAANGDVNNTGGSSNRYMGGGAVGLTGTGNAGFSDSANGTAGQCDVVGDLWSSTFGQIAGGRRGLTADTNSDGSRTRPAAATYAHGEPLSGGGIVTVAGTPNPSTLATGGDGGIGAGGGAGMNGATQAYTRGGEGGPGLVIFSYIP